MVLWAIQGRMWICKSDVIGIFLFFKRNRHFSFSGEQAFSFFKPDLFFVVTWFKAISVQHVLKHLAEEGDRFKHMLLILVHWSLIPALLTDVVMCVTGNCTGQTRELTVESQQRLPVQTWMDQAYKPSSLATLTT